MLSSSCFLVFNFFADFGSLRVDESPGDSNCDAFAIVMLSFVDGDFTGVTAGSDLHILCAITFMTNDSICFFFACFLFGSVVERSFSINFNGDDGGGTAALFFDLGVDSTEADSGRDLRGVL